MIIFDGPKFKAMEFDRGTYSYNKYTYHTKINTNIIICYDTNALQRMSELCKQSTEHNT